MLVKFNITQYNGPLKLDTELRQIKTLNFVVIGKATKSGSSQEMEFFGLDMSKSFVRSSESNGCIECFNRTLEVEVFSLNHFRTLDEAGAAIARFIDNYNKDWLIGRLGYKSPLEFMVEYGQDKLALATA